MKSAKVEIMYITFEYVTDEEYPMVDELTQESFQTSKHIKKIL